jgi:diguanylate cyclase (GGDEF)-like protein/PAS domain S-box-containing protein
MADPSNNPLTILVIEDDAGDFGLVKAYLRQAGLCAIGDANGLVWAQTLAEGITQAQQTIPDIVLLDLSLPDSSGLATVQSLRLAVPHAPIVVLTGSGETALTLAALESGAQDFLVKGRFDHDTLGRAVRHARVRERLEQRLAHSQRLYAALSQCNQAIVRCSTEPELLSQVCRIAVEFGGLQMAWIGLIDASSQQVCPVASYGRGTDYLTAIDISVDANRPGGCGPTGTAMRQMAPVWCQDFLHDDLTALWRERGEQFGWRSAAALPLWRNGVVVGCFNLYADECHAFDEASRKLLFEMSTDISFALGNFTREAERAQAQRLIVQERDFTQAALDSLPGLFYLIDQQGHFLRWNQNFEKVSGYSGAEIATLSPLDLFGEADRAPVAAAMEHTYATGETLVEADFRSKDGTTTAFLFSGKRYLIDQTPCLMGLAIDITQNRQANARVQWLSHFDALTGLANLSLLSDRFAHAISMAQHSQGTLTLMTLDLDHFKNINDTLGRHIGDALLVEVAQRIQAVVGKDVTVSRQGGDEFILLMPTTDAVGAGHLAERLLATIGTSYQIEGHELLTTPSIGMAMYPGDGADFVTLTKNADVAMYRAKQDGRNCYRFFAAEMQTRSSHTMHLESALRHALERGQLSLHYQPQVALATGQVIGAEALLRWQHPELGAVSPAEFIPIAEASGQIVQIGEWVLRTAARQMKTWLNQGLASSAAPLVMAVNLSVVQFRHPRLIEQIMQILQEEQLAPAHLELELTEGMALSDPQGAITVMNALHARGIRLSIDDFGTGYSSLNYLKRFKVYKLKIDQSFVRDLTVDPDDKAIVCAIINMARSLGLQTIAEGVETAGQLAFLRDSGCDEVQGYYYSKPLPVEAFEAFLRQAQDVV